MLVTKKYAQRILRKKRIAKCHICGEDITAWDDPITYEYVKTRGGRDVFIHKSCMKRW